MMQAHNWRSGSTVATVEMFPSLFMAAALRGGEEWSQLGCEGAVALVSGAEACSTREHDVIALPESMCLVCP
jgi:hypothetical protein